MAPNHIPLSQSNVLADLDIEQLPENLKKEGSDWFRSSTLVQDVCLMLT